MHIIVHVKHPLLVSDFMKLIFSTDFRKLRQY